MSNSNCLGKRYQQQLELKQKGSEMSEVCFAKVNLRYLFGIQMEMTSRQQIFSTGVSRSSQDLQIRESQINRLLLLSHFSHVRMCATPQMAAHQTPLSMGFSRQEYWSGLPLPSLMHAGMLSHFSLVQLCVTPWTAAHQAPLSKGFSRQEYWSGLPLPSPN